MNTDQNSSDSNIKQSSYYEWPREEILPFIPLNIKNVLDIGCGTGTFGLILKENRDLEVWGVEVFEPAAKEAMKKLDKVIIGDIENGQISLPRRYFDCIIFNDVLEHLKSPWNILEALRENLREGGYIVASIPNVRYHENIKNLVIDKDWKYVDQGILDKTHLRFFTIKTIPRLFQSAGFNLLSMTGINGAVFSWKFRLLNAILLSSLDDMRHLQFACVAQKIDHSK